MEKELKIVVEKGVETITVLHGQAEPVYHPKAITVKGGAIDSVVEYLTKNVIKPEVIEHSKVEFSFSELYIDLLYDARERNPDVIEAKLKLHPDLMKFNINSGKPYNAFELADFIKMNRHYFENKEYAMKLVSELRSFEGKVNKELENRVDDRGNKKAFINQIVESNIPTGFFIEVPVFVGQPKTRLEIEVNINSAFECFLISPDLKQLIDQESHDIIGQQICLIKEAHPELKVFEL